MRLLLVTSALLSCALPCACSGPASTGAGNSAALVKSADLPERHRAVLEAWKKGGAAWEIEHENVVRDPDLARFVVDNLIVEMVQAFDRSRIAAVGKLEGPFERAQNELVLLKEHSAPELAELLALKDGVVAFLAADTLEKIGAPAIPCTLHVLLDPHVEGRRRAAELLSKLPNAGPSEPLVLEALGARVEKDEAWIVRGQAALALGARGARHKYKGYALGVLVRALDDKDTAVGESAARAIGTLGEPRAIPKLTDALSTAAQAGHVSVVAAIEASLAGLSGEKRHLEPDGWRRWWKEHESALTQPLPPITAPPEPH
jgi:hypothetical protein